MISKEGGEPNEFLLSLLILLLCGWRSLWYCKKTIMESPPTPKNLDLDILVSGNKGGGGLVRAIRVPESPDLLAGADASLVVEPTVMGHQLPYALGIEVVLAFQTDLQEVLDLLALDISVSALAQMASLASSIR